MTDWVIPAITASASLLGAVVGGIATYWTSKKNYERQTVAEEERQKFDLLRDATVRFVSAMTEISVASAGLKEISAQWAEVTQRLAHTEDHEQFLTMAREIDPTIPSNLDRLAVLFRVVRATGVLEDDIKRAITLLTELRLVAPSDIADSAQRVIYTAFAQEITSALSPDRRNAAVDAFNGAINDFVNRVRHYMHVEDHEFDAIDKKALEHLLEF
ncbi:hypothetical protein BST22_03705 [Mycolicibacterium chubuense]|jgi:hypothetical protein|uniref:Uncharacterized protein n=1 Tax=Mycolicibacterium chubuense TaxID=1800 RepID=A0A0J6WHD6_MYCCU|nr:hypothetical protein [Mycolicibacterium chubuense]KMO81453.1 hypothetical protein MCHUDSM44219_01806 [Mycolicibacterium chubuense]ORA55636.1 hypothetical protein BST22_03705 [Mycolicibacterium chubuense]SPX95684.1 Uncharacterised protein [Mycolicibacterium chubuense]